MQALILNNDSLRQTDLSVALMQKGFHVLNAHTTACGTAWARRGSIDLLLMSERVEGVLTHSVALSAERHSPFVATILMTNRRGDDLQEMHDLLPSLYSILGEDIPADLIAILSLSCVTGSTCRTPPERPKFIRSARRSPSNLAVMNA